MCRRCESLIKAIDAYIAKKDDDLADALDNEGYAVPKKTLKAARQIEDEVAEALMEETDYFLSKINSSFDLETFAKNVWPGVMLNDELAVKLTDIFKERFTEFMPGIIEVYLQKTDKELTLESVSKVTTGWIDSWSQQLGDLMQLTSHEELQHILDKGLENGDDIAAFTRAIMDSGIRDEYYRARTTALTEVLRAHSVAQQEAFMQSPVVAGKIWRHSGAYKIEPRQNHVDMDGTRVPKDEPFILIGADGETYYPMYPRDPILPPGESINCHCIEEPDVDEKVLGLSLEERKALQQQAIDEMDDEWEKELDAQNRAKAGIE